ncbi:uncharacterized protein LOC110712520 [Chenopodium quinoa]|uniref:uncharacterized protein LOC110712520 n=1 Tax=Chenopodium quinoa TaxID=63459 RepID=UPI000B7737FF|nr:uncharacterized protein LOC110712520 [Chenopodium quinoa]
MDNNDVGEEIINENINVDNVIQIPRYQGEGSCTRPRYIPGKTTRFSVKVMPNHIPKQEEVTLEPISQTGYKLKLDGVRDRQDVLDQWKKGMSSVLNLNTEWTSENFLNYIEHSLYGCVEDWYDGIEEEVKTVLRASESPTRMFRQLCQYIEIEFIGPRADPNEKRMEYKRKLSNLSICNIKYVDDYIMEFETYYYKIGENETNLGMFYDKLPSPLNEEISEKYQEWRERFLARDALGNIIAFLRKWIEKKCREVAGTQQMKRQFLTCWDFPNNYGCERKNYNKRRNYKKNKYDRSRGETYKKKYYKHRYRKPSRFFRKATYCPEKKKTCKCWSCGELGHYANECKKANHKLMEALGN